MKIDIIDLLNKYPCISIKGTKYNPKMVLTLSIEENELPKFCIIENIILYT